jgi:hypothetical protein
MLVLPALDNCSGLFHTPGKHPPAVLLKKYWRTMEKSQD